ncbi:Hypoxanthine phosphoribosyltransferase [compost metagenome]
MLPASVVVCTLLLKPECLQYDFENIQYVGFEIEKEFVVGYGMDYNGLGRNIPDIYKNIPA